MNDRVLTTYKISDSALRELCFVGRDKDIETAIRHIRRDWDHYATMLAYVFHDYLDDVEPLSIELDVEPPMLAHIIRVYNTDYGDDALPIFSKRDLLFYDQEFQQNFIDAFRFVATIRCKPTYVIADGTRYRVRDEDRRFRLATIEPVEVVAFPEMPIAPTYTTRTFNLKQWGNRIEYDPHIMDDDHFEVIYRQTLDEIRVHFERGEGQEEYNA